MSPSVELLSWNPPRPIIRGPIGRRLPFRRPVNNFGDVLGPVVVRRLLSQLGIDEAAASSESRLLSIGSVLHMAKPGDHVWGSGVNGKELDRDYDPAGWKIHAVRGPRTRAFLTERGGSVPAVFGDPGILTARLFPAEDLPAPLFRSDVTIVPNLHDYPRFALHRNVLNPQTPLLQCIATIAASKFVVGSSLHGIILAESYGVGARPIKAGKEPAFKYDDYFEGTGRSAQTAARHVREAIDLGPVPPSQADADALVAAFPRHLWT